MVYYVVRYQIYKIISDEFFFVNIGLFLPSTILYDYLNSLLNSKMYTYGINNCKCKLQKCEKQVTIPSSWFIRTDYLLETSVILLGGLLCMADNILQLCLITSNLCRPQICLIMIQVMYFDKKISSVVFTLFPKPKVKKKPNY